MSLLRWAGSISGMGQGLERGLSQMQTGVTHMGLQEERFKQDQVARGEDRAFQTEKLKEQLSHAERLQGESLAAQSGEKGKDRAQQRELEGDRTQIEAGKAEDARAHADKMVSLKERELETAEKTGAAHRNYYQSYADYLKGGGKAGSSGAKIDLDTRKAGADFFSKRIAPLEKQLIDPLTSKEERAALQERIESLSKEGLGILGFKFDSSSTGHDIIDPLGGLPPDGGGDKAKDVKSPGPTVATPTAPPKRTNVQTMGRQDLAAAEAALKEAKATGNASLIVPLQKKYDELNARWGGLIE